MRGRKQRSGGSGHGGGRRPATRTTSTRSSLGGGSTPARFDVAELCGLAAVVLLGCGRSGYEAPLDAAPGSDALTDRVLLTLDAVTDCSNDPPAPSGGIGVTRRLAPGAHRVRATGGAINVRDGSACWWHWRMAVHTQTWSDAAWMWMGASEPPRCEQDTGTDWTRLDRATAEQDALGLELDFDIEAEADVVFYLPDTACTDNVGTIEAEVVPL